MDVGGRGIGAWLVYSNLDSSLSQHEVISAHITIPDNVVSLFVAATEHGFSQDGMLLHIQRLGKEGVLVELSELGHLFLTFGVLWGLEILQLV